ncbi:hypothetical protein [Rubrivivax gelatinosus]|uniref:hypothetical protein n=1 Tax=Rubrivivax gelatinosus TaxID=28068 RepID=UPI0009DAFD8D|nr:hypothetical protein [Rubrivivax gelatinosus]MBG6083062.1 hypothetical protein [Rubrivivax gelatinosus]
MASIAGNLHENWHNVDRLPMQVVFGVRFRSGRSTSRDVKVTVETNYEQLAWHYTEVKARAVALAAVQMEPNERPLGAEYCPQALTRPEIEQVLAAEHGFVHMAEPTLYNPVHYGFTLYKEYWVAGQLVLAKQLSNAFRYCVVPDHLLVSAVPGVMHVLVI